MKLNKHNLTIANHCADKPLSGFITNGLQFTKEGTMVINGCYSVAVSALNVTDGEPLGCITPEESKRILDGLGEGVTDVPLANTSFMKGVSPRVKVFPDTPVKFQIILNASFLLKLAQSVSGFDDTTDPLVRIQFTGESDPVRMDARNATTGQTWEALLMPRIPGMDADRFTERTSQFPPAPPVDPELTAALAAVKPATAADIEVPSPAVVEEDEFEKALRLAQGI